MSSTQELIWLGVASTDAHFEQILTLQRQNLFRSLSDEAQRREGFVFAEHTVPLLRRMAVELPQAIALSDERVVGYNLALPASFRDEIPSLKPMFRQFDTIRYRGKALSDHAFVVGGQVCVDRAFRGQGLLGRLYRETRKRLPPRYELCVTEIASRNVVSVRAHEKMGFEAIATYSDEQETWTIVAWDFREGDAESG